MPDDTRWLADEMLGRLARYLRFLGYDVTYVRGMADRAILEKVRAEERMLLTRDILLSQRAGPRAIRIRSPEIEEQLREVRRAHPALRRTVSFLRCTECNAFLVPADHSSPEPPRKVPAHLWASGAEVYLCPECDQAYWEGTHTQEIRKTFERVFGSSSSSGG